MFVLFGHLVITSNSAAFDFECLSIMLYHMKCGPNSFFVSDNTSVPFTKCSIKATQMHNEIVDG